MKLIKKCLTISFNQYDLERLDYVLNTAINTLNLSDDDLSFAKGLKRLIDYQSIDDGGE